jgi:hypothetical protein
LYYQPEPELLVIGSQRIITIKNSLRVASYEMINSIGSNEQMGLNNNCFNVENRMRGPVNYWRPAAVVGALSVPF